MDTTALPAELQVIEKLREEEREEARSIQSMMLPAESLPEESESLTHFSRWRRWVAIFSIISS
jgi:hypothetical protein